MFVPFVLISSQKQLSKPDVDGIMQQLGLGPESRAEELTVDQMLALWHTVDSVKNPEA